MRYFPFLAPAVAVVMVVAPVQASVTEAEAKAFIGEHEKLLNTKAVKNIETQLDQDLKIVINGDPTPLGRKDFVQVIEDAFKNYKTYKAELNLTMVSANATEAITEGITTETFNDGTKSDVAKTKWKYTLQKKRGQLVITKIELSNP